MAQQLTDKQRKFAARVAVHGNLTLAAEEAGYSNPNVQSQDLVKKPHVAAEVQRLRSMVLARRDKKTIADAEELQRFLTKLLRGKIKDYDLSLSGESVERPPKVAERRKAAMDLAKLLGLLRERVEHSGPDGTPIELAALSFRELLEYAKLGGDE